MSLRLALTAALLVLSVPVLAQQADQATGQLSQRLAAVDAGGEGAALERLQARQALEALGAARGKDREAAYYQADRRVQIAEIAARTAQAQRQIDQMDRERSELLVEASRRDAAKARAEAERLRIEAQVRAEEAERLRQQAEVGEAAMQNVEQALEGVVDVQSAKLNAAREKAAALARQEAELMAGGKLPASRQTNRGEVFTLSGDAFASGKATLTSGAAGSLRALATYIAAAPTGAIVIEGHTDSQGQAEANRRLSQQRAEAVKAALVAGGVPDSSIQANGRGATQPVADNKSPAGRAKNRRVEITIGRK